MGTQTLDIARVHLRRLDHLLDELEELNLNNERRVPSQLANALESEGVQDADMTSVTDLIDRVFDMQEPVLRRIRDRSRWWRLYRVGR